MRKIKIFAHISLDGIISPEARKDNDDDYVHGGWMMPYRSEAGRDAITEMQGNNFDLLLGRRTYDLWSNYWPKAEKSPIENSLNAAKKYVATHRSESLTWGPYKTLGTDIIKEISGIKSTEGPNLITWGSTSLTSVLLEQGLADEIILCIYPILLGSGIRFFSEKNTPAELALIDTTKTPTGVLINRYSCIGLQQKNK